MTRSEHPRDPRSEEDASRHREAGAAKSEPKTESARPRPEEPAEYDLRGGFERILPELLRRGLSAGKERVGESSFPRELTSSLIAHVGDIRSGIVRAVAQEVGRFLRDADIASELRKVMAGLDVEAQVRLRFHQREDGTLQPKVELDGSRRSGERSTKRPSEPPTGRER